MLAMDRLNSLIYLESVSTMRLQFLCKAIGYGCAVLFGFGSILYQIYGASFMLMHHWSLRSLLYGLGNIEEVWTSNRAIFGYFVIKGVKEDNPSYILPLVIDACTGIFSCLIYLSLLPFAFKDYQFSGKLAVEISLGFLLDVTIVVLVGNFFRRLRRGNLQAASEQMDP